VSEPERQCIGCGRRGPQADFLRLTLDKRQTPPRVVVARGRERTGRGAYLCRRQACLDRALHRKAFQRGFRASVIVAEEEIGEELVLGVKPGRDGQDG
jgi:predicted RNA-binding protein YlxR (DUF448 family)